MTQTLPSTTSTIAPSSDLNSNTPATTCTDVSPWTQPELKKNPALTLEKLRDVKQQLTSLVETEAQLKAAVAEYYEEGLLAEYVDEQNSQKYNGNGISVMLVSGRKVRKWDPEVQQQLDKITFVAERKGLYTDTPGKSSWRVMLPKPR